MNSFKYIFLGIMLLLIQLLISGYVNIWPMVYIAVFPLLLITIPYSCNRTLAICTALVYGLIIDLLSDGVPGLNASAAVALAYFRPLFFRLIIPKSTLENLTDITTRYVSTSQFLVITVLCYSIFFIFYITLDAWGYFSFFYTFARFILNIIVNTALALLLWKSLNSQIIR